jgi:hypothetical protein
LWRIITVRGWGVGALFAAVLFWPSAVRGHTPGVSIADFEVLADGEVQARLTLATAEPLGALVFDRDRDGVVTPEDVSAAHDDLRAWLLDGLEVDADGSACAPTFVGASVTEVDGLSLQASYSCPSDAAEIEATLYYLSAQSRGSPHKTIARIVSGSATTEAVLSGERRAIALRLPGRVHGGARKPVYVGVLVAAAVLSLLVWTSRRWRAARAPWQNRAP